MNNSVFSPLADVLSAALPEIRVFFRNDDGGWADRRMRKLCHCFRQQNIALDVALIPAAMNTTSVDAVIAELNTNGSTLHIHQHGYAHTNHQLDGRACEFGSNRSEDNQRIDIAQGQKILEQHFGNLVEPIFTPPWNRCTSNTTAVLKSLGFRYLSRITGSQALNSELPEINVSIDWLKKRKGLKLSVAELVDYACDRFSASTGAVGVMLHHEHMDSSNRELLLDFISVLKNSSNVRFCSMLETVNQQQTVQ